MEKQGPLLLSLSKIHGCFLCKIFVNNLTIPCRKHITRRCVCQPQKQWFSSFFLWEKEGENALFEAACFLGFWETPRFFFWIKHTASLFLKKAFCFLGFFIKLSMFWSKGKNNSLFFPFANPFHRQGKTSSQVFPWPFPAEQGAAPLINPTQ